MGKIFVIVHRKTPM